MSPRRPPRDCLEPRCPRPAVALGRCSGHQHKARTRDYSDPRWKTLRTRVLARDALCRHCRDELSEVAHHVDPEGPDELENLVGLCHACHNRRHREDGTR